MYTNTVYTAVHGVSGIAPLRFIPVLFTYRCNDFRCHLPVLVRSVGIDVLRLGDDWDGGRAADQWGVIRLLWCAKPCVSRCQQYDQCSLKNTTHVTFVGTNFTYSFQVSIINFVKFSFIDLITEVLPIVVKRVYSSVQHVTTVGGNYLNALLNHLGYMV